MRDYKGMKRQRGRNRGGGQGGGKPGQNANRAFDSQGPENIKVRGHAQHVYEKYNQLARDATSSGDRVLAENHLQHAEHYFRTLRVLQPNRPVTEIVGRDTFVNGFDLDFEDEALESAMAAADAAAATQPQAQPSAEGGEGQGEGFGQQGERQNQDGQRREFRDRNERQGGYNQQDRGDRPRYENRRDRWEDRGERQDRPGGGQAQGQSQGGERNFEQRDRQDRQGGLDRQERGDRPRYENRRDRWERSDRAAEAPTENVDAAAMVAPESAAPPRSTFEPESSEAGRVLRSEDGGVSEAPAFLSAAAATPQADEGGEVRRPRTRRPRRRPEDEGEARAASEAEEA